MEMPETNMLWTDPNEVIDVFSDEEPGCTIGSQCKSFEAGKRNVVSEQSRDWREVEKSRRYIQLHLEDRDTVQSGAPSLPA